MAINDDITGNNQNLNSGLKMAKGPDGADAKGI